MVLESNTYIDISPYHEILSGMNFILSISVGVVKLTGPEGTGKTRLLQQLESELQAEKQETLLFLQAPASIKDLHDTISRRLRLDNEFGFNKALIHHIIAKPYDQQRLVVAFDDAEKIDMDVLLAIALFRNILHNGQPIISIVLCGSEALNAKLEDTSYRPLVQDLLLSYELNPLTREQLQAYAKASADIHRLGQLPLKNGVLTKLLNDSQGLPGAVPGLLEKLRDEAHATPPAAKPEVAQPAAVVPSALVPSAVAQPAAAKAAIAKPAAVSVVTAAQTEVPAAELDPDARLVLASRAEASASAGRFAFAIDWQRWKPVLQGTAVAAGLLVVVVVGWPRIAPTVSNLYANLGADAPPPAPASAEPAAAAVVEPAVSAAPEPAVPEAPVPVTTVADATAVESAAEPAVAAPAPITAEALVQAPQPAAALEPAVTAPAATLATTPAPPVPAQALRIPGPTLTNAGSDELEKVIRDWLTAWQQQDVANFFSYYHTDFAPLYQNTLAAWRTDRQARISRPASIMIEVEDFMVGPSSRLGTRVSFWMTYESPNYADRTLKEVLIGPDLDGRLRILQEYNEQVAQVDPATFRAGLALDQQAPAAPSRGPRRTSIATTQIAPNAFPDVVEPPVVAARAALTQDQIDEVARFLAAWLTAWQNQDVDEYFRHYAPQYKPASMASTDQWRDDRIEKIVRPSRIVLRMDQLEILAGDETNVRVQLVLEYHSTHYADRTVKELALQKAPSGAWLITLEKNKQVEPLPLMRLLPMDSLALLF